MSLLKFMCSLFRGLRGRVAFGGSDKRTDSDHAVTPSALPPIDDGIGWTPLMSAAFRGDIEEARLLLKSGAEVSDTMVGGHTALMVACACGSDEVATLLAGNGAAKLVTTDYLGYAPLVLAVGKCNYDTVSALIGAGADVNASTWNEVTALRYAFKLNRHNLVKLLVRSGAIDDREPPYDDVDIFTVPLLMPGEIRASVYEPLRNDWRVNLGCYAVQFDSRMRDLVKEMTVNRTYFGVRIIPFGELVRLSRPGEGIWNHFSQEELMAVGKLIRARPYRIYEMTRGFQQEPPPSYYDEYLCTIFELIDSGVLCTSNMLSKEPWSYYD